jgi:hypothetical protein
VDGLPPEVRPESGLNGSTAERILMLDHSLKSAIIESHLRSRREEQPAQRPLFRRNWGALRELLTPEWILDHSWLKNKKKWAKSAKLRKKLLRRPYHYLTEDGKAIVVELAMVCAIPRINYDVFAERAFPIEQLPVGTLLIYDKGE